MSLHHFDRSGEPITFQRWCLLFEDRRYQVVERTEIGNVLISTVWLGLDHGFGRSDEPLIFETMIFGGAEAEELYRYASEDEARAHHAKLVEQMTLIASATR